MECWENVGRTSGPSLKERAKVAQKLINIGHHNLIVFGNNLQTCQIFSAPTQMSTLVRTRNRNRRLNDRRPATLPQLNTLLTCYSMPILVKCWTPCHPLQMSLSNPGEYDHWHLPNSPCKAAMVQVLVARAWRGWEVDEDSVGGWAR